MAAAPSGDEGEGGLKVTLEPVELWPMDPRWAEGRTIGAEVMAVRGGVRCCGEGVCRRFEDSSV
jgi:hypothetical protein